MALRPDTVEELHPRPSFDIDIKTEVVPRYDMQRYREEVFSDDNLVEAVRPKPSVIEFALSPQQRFVHRVGYDLFVNHSNTVIKITTSHFIYRPVQRLLEAVASKPAN